MAPDFFQPLRMLAAYYHDRMAAVGAAEGLAEMLDAPPEEAATGTVPMQAGALDIVFDDVSVAFEGGARSAVRGVRLRIAPGAQIAPTGITGPRTTTPLSLLLGFRRPDNGPPQSHGP